MGRVLLTVDLGNTSCKVVLRGEDREARFVLPTGDGLADRLVERLGEQPEPDGAALSSVAGGALEAAVRARLAELYGAAFRGSPDPGVVNTCEEPHTVGADRLYAARGALELARRSVIVVDVGTALTVDAVEVGEGGVGRFLGGAIAPGPFLLVRALASGGARLPDVDPEPGVPALGRHTRAAIRAGVAVGFRGAVRELVRGIGAESGIGRDCIVLTGGARAFAGGDETFGRARVHEVDDLVHRGLRAALESA